MAKRSEMSCGVQRCPEPVWARGWCKKHYTTPHGIERMPAQRYVPKTGPCLIEGCQEPRCRRGWCSRHYQRWKRLGTPYGEDLRAQNGTGTIRGGYRIIRKGNERRPEHHYVMEEKLGRALLPGENVHHLNGVRHDNRPENLELWLVMQPSGQRVEDAVAWAKEVLGRYEPDTLRRRRPSRPAPATLPLMWS